MKSMRKILLIALVIVGVMLGVWFWSKSTLVPNSTSKLRISTSIYPLFFFTSELTGNNTLVQNLTPAGIEPHDYEPGPRDIAGIESSQLLVLNGGSLETWVNRVGSLGNVRTIVTGEGLFQGSDPHIWLAPPLAKKQVEKILLSLITIDSFNRSTYEIRAQILENKLDDLNRKFSQGLKDCQRRDFITSHSAFSYLASTYHLSQIAISGLSPDEEPSLKKLTEIATLAKAKNIKVIFFETLVSPKLAQVIAGETGAQTAVLNPIEGLTDAEMKAGKNYFTIMEDNLSNLRAALSCK